MSKEKWSKVKLSEKELREIRKEERIEIMAEIIAFIFLIALGIVAVACITAFMRGIQ